MDTESGVPILDFRKSTGITLEEGGQGWKEMIKKVREAFESHSMFLLRCDEIPKELQNEMFANIKSLFDLPEETKTKFTGKRVYRGYTSKSVALPNSQTFGIDDTFDPNETRSFTKLMWPEGNPNFREALLSFSSEARKISSFILKMVVEGFGLPENYISEVEELCRGNDTRLTKYPLPKETTDSAITFVPHTDKFNLTFISENEVQGLQLLQKSGNWVNVNVPSNGFVVMVGEMLQVWSNGRFKAPIHRVAIRGNKDRYVFILFSLLKEETFIKVPPELVDEDHPLRYKTFMYEDFINFIKTVGTKLGAFEDFAGI
ncbi:2-oxoglutarate-dependent dioxygenase AOP3-like [Vicia villosa]|uniref:2-oxoglutarate-dependent dioxygenase AOP3-like n=1 Tax=Vicia villosa TaxID=3911 RepID=UPI00273AE8E0|nr:2-oxoglutarate-dependent dioxygenase AOP3-like [Vicia villosa]